MIDPAGGWCDRVHGCGGILRHFDAIADLEPLLLIKLNYDSRSLDIEFASFTAPIRYTQKWSKELNGGTRFRLVGSTNRLIIRTPIFCFATSIETSGYAMTGVVFSGGQPNECEFQGVALRLRQNDEIVIAAECSTLRLAGIRPIDSIEADHYRNPERYA